MMTSREGKARSKKTWIISKPESWETRPLFALFEERGETNDAYRTENVLSVVKDIGVINYEDKGDVGNKKADDIERYKIVYPGDLVINSMNVIIGSVGVSSEYGALSPVYIVLKPRNQSIDMRYYGYVFASRDFQRWLTRIGYGILEHRMRIPIENLKREYVPYPPLAQQSAIADFLDRETAEADALIAKYERLLELLEEKRVALITQAVTKGLDPNAPMKDSGIEWIGEIPAHWLVMNLGIASSLQSGFAFPSAVFCDDEVRIIQMNNLKGGKLDLTDAKCVPTEYAREDMALSEGDLLIGMSGSLGDTGSVGNVARVAKEDLPCQLNQRVGRFKTDGKLVTLDYVALIVRSQVFRIPMALRATGTAQFNISPEQVGRTRIAVPSLDEQAAIVKWVNGEELRLNALVVSVSRAITLLMERRSALITAAVTGQVDVTNYKSSITTEVA